MLVAASSPASTASKNDPVTLSPFVVTELTDTGYAATSSLDGSRLNTSLKDTPGAISVFTKDLLDDLSATSIEDILRYDVNADMTHGGDEFCCVIAGAIRYRIAERIVDLAAGDYLQFKSSIRHSWENAHPGETRVLWVFSDELSF